MVPSKPELLALRDLRLAWERGEPLEDTAEMRDILRRVAALQKEMERESKPKKLQGEV
jgi:hypothetical protein